MRRTACILVLTFSLSACATREKNKTAGITMAAAGGLMVYGGIQGVEARPDIALPLMIVGIGFAVLGAAIGNSEPRRRKPKARTVLPPSSYPESKPEYEPPTMAMPPRDSYDPNSSWFEKDAGDTSGSDSDSGSDSGSGSGSGSGSDSGSEP